MSAATATSATAAYGLTTKAQLALPDRLPGDDKELARLLWAMAQFDRIDTDMRADDENFPGTRETLWRALAQGWMEVI